MVRPPCVPTVFVVLAFLAIALASPLDALAAFKKDTTPLDPSVTGGSAESTSHVSSSGGAGAFARMVVGLVIVIAVIFAVYWLLKTYSRSKGSLREDGRIQVLATTALGQNRAVHLIEVDGAQLLV